MAIISATDSTYTGIFRESILDAARDCLSDYWGNYVFFVNNNNRYWLVKFDEYTYINGNITCVNPEITEFLFVPHDGQSIVDDIWIYPRSFDASQYQFDNPDNELAYSNIGYYPRLQGGETYVNFAFFGVFCIACIFGLFVRVFRAVN